MFVASPVVSVYLQQIQDQTLIHFVLYSVQNEPLAAIHPPPLRSPPSKGSHQLQGMVVMARDANSTQFKTENCQEIQKGDFQLIFRHNLDFLISSFNQTFA